jgi:hypothetical protein
LSEVLFLIELQGFNWLNIEKTVTDPNNYMIILDDAVMPDKAREVSTLTRVFPSSPRLRKDTSCSA